MNEHLQQPVEIRAMALEDSEQLSRFMQMMWMETYPNEQAGITVDDISSMASDLNPEDKRKRLQEKIDDPNQLRLVAYARDELIAQAGAINHGHAQEVKTMYVHPDYQGHGLAQRLMSRFEEWFDDSKPTFLWVTSYNERAQAFYRKSNFEIVEGETKRFKQLPKMTIIKMERPAKEQL